MDKMNQENTDLDTKPQEKSKKPPFIQKAKVENRWGIKTVEPKMPMDDQDYLNVIDILYKQNPDITLMYTLPIGLSSDIDSVKYIIYGKIPVPVVLSDSAGNHTKDIMDRTFMAFLIKPPSYKEVDQTQDFADSENMNIWRSEQKHTLSNYQKIKFYCDDKRILMFEEMYDCKLGKRIFDLKKIGYENLGLSV